MKTIKNENRWGRIDRYEVVDTWPAGCVVWNIGRENFRHEGYLPLAYVSADYQVDMSMLKAYHVGDEALCLKVLAAAGRGTVDYERFKTIRDE
jgi:hypothetical protein